MMSAEAVLQYPSQAARNFELLAGFMKSAADFADEAGRKLLKVFKAVVITGDETGECRKEDMIDLARHEAFLELVKRPETVEFKSTVAAGLARANNEMHDVLGELRIYNKERRQETPEAKNEPNLQILNRMTDREY